MKLIDQARELLDEIESLTQQDDRRKTLMLYARAMADAIAKGDEKRIKKGLEIVRPVVTATRELDLIG